ncbi:serine O-acetyltransferase [Romboutsia hominis]|uniref:Serine acetyltransferase n=1 Tax=Romboutsia hominis TaxID=1507512 RepID=A0A2P2BSP6_9FIRM|nr:hypothetical protein [Romboutsia hominis]CEI73360.1 Serine acetyltransferase [Romboutsia hominis]
MNYQCIWENINIVRSIPAMIIYNISKDKGIIKKDIERWKNIKHIDRNSLNTTLNYLLVNYPEYRNLFYYRISRKNKILGKIVLPLFYRPLNSLYIFTPDIGGGLFIQHGFSTIISAKSIGENCWINQQVTIGYSNDIDCPTICDNVKITSGAKIIGDVKISENSIIGSNCVVVKSVPKNCTVIGNPAIIIKKNGIKTYEYLK